MSTSLALTAAHKLKAAMADGSLASPLLISHITLAQVLALTPWGTAEHWRRNSSRSHT